MTKRPKSKTTKKPAAAPKTARRRKLKPAEVIEMTFGGSPIEPCAVTDLEVVYEARPPKRTPPSRKGAITITMIEVAAPPPAPKLPDLQKDKPVIYYCAHTQARHGIFMGWDADETHALVKVPWYDRPLLAPEVHGVRRVLVKDIVGGAP